MGRKDRIYRRPNKHKDWEGGHVVARSPPPCSAQPGLQTDGTGQRVPEGWWKDGPLPPLDRGPAQNTTIGVGRVAHRLQPLCWGCTQKHQSTSGTAHCPTCVGTHSVQAWPFCVPSHPESCSTRSITATSRDQSHLAAHSTTGGRSGSLRRRCHSGGLRSVRAGTPADPSRAIWPAETTYMGRPS